VCGIAGFLTSDSCPRLDPSRFAAALASLRHRGPDMQDQWSEDRLWLGHTRLSIIDLSATGQQPMVSADGRFVLVYNGELYNHREIARDLGLTGLRGRSDSEVIVEAIARQGLAIIPRFRGIFAFAIYDRLCKKLSLVRDQLGIKPLYIGDGPQGFAFASEVRPLIELGVPSVLNVAAVHEWLYYGNALGEHTMFADVEQIGAGTALTIDLETGDRQNWRFWALSDNIMPGLGEISDSAAAIEVEQRIRHAVSSQLVADVDTGVMLSGGVDSGTIAAFATEMTSGPLNCFSARFDFGGNDETGLAAKVAERFGARHHIFDIGSTDVSAIVPLMVEHHGAPFSDAANIPLFMMARAIGDSCKVVLQGDGGDELFGGYRRYQTLRRFPALGYLARAADALLPDFGSASLNRLRRYVSAIASADPAELFARLLTVEDIRHSPIQVVSPAYRDIVSRFEPFKRYREKAAQWSDRDLASAMLMVDKEIILHDIFLPKVDRATMASGVEARVPLLDLDLVEYVAGLPIRMKVRGSEKKWLLRHIMRSRLPRDVVDGAKKGFGVPFGHWIANGLRDQAVTSIAAFQQRTGFLDQQVVDRMFAEHVAGKRDHGFMLWKLFNLALWQDVFKVDFKQSNA
jgi:asparagine synthase (glutamine-hydrolysing)